MKISNATQGGIYIADTNHHAPGTEGIATGSLWGVLQILEDAKFHALNGNLAGVADEENAPTIPAGAVLEGSFSGLQLHSGAIIAYYA